MQKYRQIIGKVNYFLFLLAAFTMGCPSVIMRWTWTAWVIAWLLELRFCKKEFFSFQKYKLPLILLGVYFIWQCITCIWSIDASASVNALGRQISFIILPLIAMFGVNEHYKPKQIAICMILGVMVMTIVYNVYVFTQPRFYKWHSVFFSYTDWLYADSFNELKHRFHFAIAVIVAAILSVLNIIPSYKRGRMVAFVVFFFFITYLSLALVGSRGGIICSLLLLIIYTIAYSIRRRKWWILCITILIAIGGVTYLQMNHRMQKVDLESVSDNNVVLQNKGGDSRFPIWITALKHIDEYVFKGMGVGTSITFLKGKFMEDGMSEEFSSNNFHSHQQFIESCIDSGIIGLLLLLSVLIACVVCATPQVKQLATYLMLMYGMVFCFDSVIRSAEGVILFCFTMVLLYVMNQCSGREV